MRGEQKGGKIYFRGSNGNYYDGWRSYKDGVVKHLARVLKYEPNTTIFDAQLTADFDLYYKTLQAMGYLDNAENGASLDSPDKSFSYVVTLLGEVCSIVIKVEAYNWIHIHHAGWLFDGMDNGREFLDHYKALKDKGLKRCNTLALTASGLYKLSLGGKYGYYYPDCYRTQINENETLYDFLYGGYRGGFNFLSESEKGYGRDVAEGYVYDVNSLYPYVFAYYPMPDGSATYRTGTPPKWLAKLANKGERFVMVRIEADYKVKDGRLPFVMPDRHAGVSSEGCRILTLTWLELKLFREHYNAKVKYIDYIYMGTNKGIGRDFVREHYNNKRNAPNEIERRISKGVLNYLIGGFSRKMVRRNLIKDKNGDWTIHKTESPGPSAMYIGVAVTSYARCKIVQDAQKNYASFVYSDTDSLHLTAPAVGISLGDGLGQYKQEAHYTEACYLKQKYYGYKDTEKGIKIVSAGVPKRYTKKIAEEYADHDIVEIMENLQAYALTVADEGVNM